MLDAGLAQAVDADFDTEPEAEAGTGVLVALPSELTRRGLCDMLQHADGVTWIHACAPRPDGLPWEHVARRPDIVIISGTGDPAGTAVAARQAADRRAKVLIFLERIDPEAAQRVGDVYADGYLLQDGLSVTMLTDTLRRLTRGEFPIPAVFGRHLVAQSRDSSRSRTRKVRLTPREQSVLELIAEGLSNKQIARRFAISEHGVKRHVTNLLAKLNCPNRTLAVSLALQHGLISAGAPEAA